jgi:RimJ/RimL family protein N-acetyltransferase
MILTPRLRLRPLAAADAAPSAALMSEPISRRTGSWPPDISPAEVLERIERAGRSEAGGNGFTRAIERLSDQTLMGWIGVDRIAGQPGEGTIGYWLGEAFWGQGYASEAAAAMLDAAWKRLDLQRVEAGVQPDNLASLAVIRRLGMTGIAPRAAFASARQREELCLYFEIRRPLAST